MRRNHMLPAILVSLALGLSPLPLAACAGDAADETATTATASGEDAPSEAEAAASPSAAVPADGTYEIGVTTDSSMFHAAHCTLEVTEAGMVAHLALPGEGFSRLFYGTADEAALAADAEAGTAEIFDYHVGEDGLYTFDLPVPALDEELAIAAFGQRRDTWYDHTITFASPAGDAS